MNATSETSASSNASKVDEIFGFLREAASPKNRKTTFILLYAVLALSVWKYVPSAPRFADSSSGRCVLSAETFANDEEKTDPDAVATFNAPNFSATFVMNENSATFNLAKGSGESSAMKPLDGTLDGEISTLDFLWNARKIGAAFLLMGVIPALCVKFLFKESLTQYGLTLGDAKRTFRTFLTFAPIMLLLGWLSAGEKAFYSVYPYNPAAGVSWRFLLLHSATYLFLYYAAWEFMFRGFIQRGLEGTVGATTAVLIQVLASTMLHYGHPASETFGCVAGGLLWGFLAIRTRSLASGWAQHALLGIALDWGLIFAAGR